MSQQLSTEMAIRMILDQRVLHGQMSVQDYDRIIILLRGDQAERGRLEGIEQRLVSQLLHEQNDWKKQWIVEFLGYDPVGELVP